VDSGVLVEVKVATGVLVLWVIGVEVSTATDCGEELQEIVSETKTIEKIKYAE